MLFPLANLTLVGCNVVFLNAGTCSSLHMRYINASSPMHTFARRVRCSPLDATLLIVDVIVVVLGGRWHLIPAILIFPHWVLYKSCPNTLVHSCCCRTHNGAWMWRLPDFICGSSTGVMVSGAHVVHVCVPGVAFMLDFGTHGACLVIVLQW